MKEFIVKNVDNEIRVVIELVKELTFQYWHQTRVSSSLTSTLKWISYFLKWILRKVLSFGQCLNWKVLKSILAGFKDSKDFHNTFTVKTPIGTEN